ncbi:MAG: Gfo/Idh/MocA family oxidoreductase [Actinomycetota bacterium]|nr:Gfo/Idh/MocA family oxidoreductase [Actinomycetota bacterium]
MKKITTGVAGTGFIEPVHVANSRRIPSVDVKAIVSHSIDWAAALAENLCIMKFYGNWEETIKDNTMEVVYIATLNDLHYPIARMCLEFGKHVICEKPFEDPPKTSLPIMLRFGAIEGPCQVKILKSVNKNKSI